MTSNIIRDGYTREGYVEPVEGLHEGLDFSYRPMLPEVVEEIESQRETLKAKEAVRVIAAALAKHLTRWSEDDSNGCDVGINFENVRRLPWALLNRVYRIVAGTAPSDLKPNATEQQQGEYTRQLLQEINDEPIQQEADAKN